MVNLSDQIVQIVNELSQKCGVAINWSSDTLLPFMQKIMTKMIHYELISSIVCMVVCIVLLVSSVLVCKRTIKAGIYDKYGILSMRVLICVCAVPTGVLSGLGIVCQILDIIACLTFPEKILIEYVQSIITTM